MTKKQEFTERWKVIIIVGFAVAMLSFLLLTIHTTSSIHPYKECETITHEDFITLDHDYTLHTFEEESKVSCDLGVDMGWPGMINFDIWDYCGYNMYTIVYEEKENEEIHNCLNTEKRTCLITWEEEVCEIK